MGQDKVEDLQTQRFGSQNLTSIAWFLQGEAEHARTHVTLVDPMELHKCARPAPERLSIICQILSTILQ